MRRIAPALLIALAPLPAQAHLVGMEFGAFYAGALHLLISPEHVTILLALALIAAFQPREQARWMLAALPLGFAVGTAAMALTDASVPLAVVGLTLALTGLLAALALPVGAVVLAGLAAGLAALHGYANMLPAEGTEQLWLYALGVIAAGTVAGTALTAVLSTLIDRKTWVPLAYRVVSGWIVAVGTMYAGLSTVG